MILDWHGETWKPSCYMSLDSFIYTRGIQISQAVEMTNIDGSIAARNIHSSE